MVRATGIESNGGADEDIAIDTPAMSAAVIGDIIDALAGVLSCSREVIELAVMTLSAATRDAQGVRFGVSPRGRLNVAAMARARALMQGRDFVMADDVRSVVVPVLAHRGCAGVDAGAPSMGEHRDHHRAHVIRHHEITTLHQRPRTGHRRHVEAASRRHSEPHALRVTGRRGQRHYRELNHLAGARQHTGKCVDDVADDRRRHGGSVDRDVFVSSAVAFDTRCAYHPSRPRRQSPSAGAAIVRRPIRRGTVR